MSSDDATMTACMQSEAASDGVRLNAEQPFLWTETDSSGSLWEQGGCRLTAKKKRNGEKKPHKTARHRKRSMRSPLPQWRVLALSLARVDLSSDESSCDLAKAVRGKKRLNDTNS